MTVPTTTSRVSYPGAGSTGPFAFPYRVIEAQDLLVTKRGAVGGETALALTTDYTVSGAGNATGSVTLVVALAVGETLVIRRVPALTQDVSLSNQAPYYGSVQETEFDMLVMQLQALQDEIARSVKLSETLDPAVYSTTLPIPVAGQVVTGTGAGFTMTTLDASAVSLPGGGRTVSTLSAYLADNAVCNVKDYGAVGDGVTDDTAAFLATVTAAGAYGAIYVPPGSYKLTSVITLGRFNWMVGAGPATILVITHAGDGVLFSSVPAPAIEARKPGIENLRFLHGGGFTPLSFIANQAVDNLVCADLTIIETQCVTGIENRQGYLTQLRNVVFNVVTATQCVWFRQNSAGAYWTTAPLVQGCDITSITGNGIVFDGAAGAIRDTVIESCSGDGLVLCNVAGIGAGGSPMMITLENVYFEANTGYALRDINNESNLWVKATGCIFYAGVGASKTNCNGRYIFENCVANPGNTMTGGGTVRFRNTNAIASTNGTFTGRLIIEDYTHIWGPYTGVTAAQTFQLGINVNGSLGGGSALILCSADDGAGGANGTISELFLIRYGYSGNNYTATSVSRSAPVGTAAFTFGVDASGNLTIVSNPTTNNAKYLVLAQIETGVHDTRVNG